MSASVLAVVDIGSNSIKLLVAAPGPPGGPELRVLFQEALETRISGGLGKDKSSLSEAGLAAGVQAVSRLLEMARPYAPTRIHLVATSAVRDAQNRADFAARILAATGLPLEILSGDDEALLIARGLRTDPALGGASEFCLLDLGGGSLECIRCASDQIKQAVSLQLGAVRLTEKFVPNPRGPFDDAARTAVAEETRRAVSASGFHFIPGGLLVGTGGAFTVARAILAHRQGFIAKETWPAEMSRASLAALLDEIAPLDAAARARIPKLTPERADILPTALTTILTLLDLARVARVFHSFHNLRFGVAARDFAQLRGER
jgi:exopolyphosphatase/guanosine-5'-triphosphate,3'-diphosphate pyrophosphatase